VQCFINGLPKDYRNRIEFDEAKTLEGTIQKETYCHEQFGHRAEPREGWNRSIVQDFIKRGLNSQDLRTI
jgi:hypothetical protein